MHGFLTDSQKEKLRAQAKEKGQQLIEMGPGDPVTAEIHIGDVLRHLHSVGAISGEPRAADVSSGWE